MMPWESRRRPARWCCCTGPPATCGISTFESSPAPRRGPLPGIIAYSMPPAAGPLPGWQAARLRARTRAGLGGRARPGGSARTPGPRAARSFGVRAGPFGSRHRLRRGRLPSPGRWRPRAGSGLGPAPPGAVYQPWPRRAWGKAFYNRAASRLPAPCSRLPPTIFLVLGPPPCPGGRLERNGCPGPSPQTGPRPAYGGWAPPPPPPPAPRFDVSSIRTPPVKRTPPPRARGGYLGAGSRQLSRAASGDANARASSTSLLSPCVGNWHMRTPPRFSLPRWS